jgi:Uma2 family endonuclease
MSDAGQLEIPSWVGSLETFRRWLDSDLVPEDGRVCYLEGKVWIDISKEQLFSHVLVKTEFTVVLGRLVKEEKLGLFLGDGALFCSVDADIAAKADATFVSTASLVDRVRLIEGKEGGYVELEGAPDMMLEVVSQSSVRKDYEILRKGYWDAGVREYWLVDARKEPLRFDLLQHTANGYRAAVKKDDWVKSKVFARSFRLIKGANRLVGHSEFTLQIR